MLTEPRSTIGVADVKARLSEYLARVAYTGERVLILSRSKPKAALVSVDDLRRLEEWEEQQESALLAQAIESGPPPCGTGPGGIGPGEIGP